MCGIKYGLLMFKSFANESWNWVGSFYVGSNQINNVWKAILEVIKVKASLRQIVHSQLQFLVCATMPRLTSSKLSCMQLMMWMAHKRMDPIMHK